MNQELRNRRAIDLDELERQLRLSAETSDARGVADPLAELARLVGNDDPFKDILGQGGLPRQQGRAADEALRALETEFAADLRPAYGSQSDDPYAQPQDDDGYQGYEHEPQSYDPRPPVQSRTTVAPPRRSLLRSRGFVVAGGAMALACVGVFTVFGMRSEHATGSGNIPVIAAKPGQDKVRPANPGGVDVPNQNKQVFEPEIERAAADNAKVVTTTEQPIDLAAAPLAATPRTVPAEGAAQLPAPTGPGSDGAPAQQASAPLAPAAGNEPKRVRSIAITVNDAGSETTATASAAPPASPQSGITAALGQNGIAAVPSAPTPAAPTPSAAVPPPAAPSRVAVAPAVASPEDPAPSTVSTPTHASPATPAKTTPKAAKQAPHAPLSLAPPPKGTRVAAAHVEAPAARSSGGWAVQLGWRSSPSVAQQAAQSFSTRYGNVLGGATPHVVPGESGGKQIYRIRVSAGERSNATGLCEKIKTAGGSCFVARN